MKIARTKVFTNGKRLLFNKITFMLSLLSIIKILGFHTEMDAFYVPRKIVSNYGMFEIVNV
jgi:hypothetical protein